MKVKVTIRQIINESPRVKRFILVPESGEFDAFLPGQFVVLENENWEYPNKNRSYSISSVHSNPNELELCVALNEKGVFTPWLFSLNVGDTLDCSQPQGKFILKEDEHSLKLPHLFIATGTGIAPFLSMINEVLSKSQSKVYLIYGNRFEQDILYKGYFEALSLKNNNFKFLPILSRESKPNIAQGYVHALYKNVLESIVDARIYVCGWKEMCVDTRNELKALGFNRRQYFFEQYD